METSNFAGLFLYMDKAWKRYLQNHNIAASPMVSAIPDLCVVIPCYYEAGIMDTIHSLEVCKFSRNTLVIVVVNSGENTDSAVVNFNRSTYNVLLEYAFKNTRDNFSLYPIIIENVRKKHAGVGFARKTGMDLAVSLFAAKDKTNGVIVSLDADTLVEKNFLNSIYDKYTSNSSITLSTHFFKHYVTSEDKSGDITRAINQYELYLRYFRLAQEYCGFPYHIHTVGSAFAISADLYVKSGGMNRRQGGEDFYFLHKVIPNARHEYITDTCIYPQGRISDRVPFGTGPVIRKLSETEEEYFVYNPSVFNDLKKLFNSISELYKKQCFQNIELNSVLLEFLISIQFEKKLIDIKRNSASLESFKKKFFQVFDAFQMVKFLNYAHQNEFEKVNIKTAATNLLEMMLYKTKKEETISSLLKFYIDLETS